MASEVYFWNMRASSKSPYASRIRRLLRQTGAADHIREGDLTAVKIHFGEAGGTGFISPLRLKPVLDFFIEAGAKPFLTDTGTLYVGQRGEAVSHKLTAARHGFDPNILGAPVIIADGLRSQNEATVPLEGGKFIRDAFVAGDIVAADALVTVSHFKGHGLAGFGGALKNVAMGCATRRGKMQQHRSLGPIVKEDECVACEECVAVCAPGALEIGENGKVVLNPELCVGCGSCFHACNVSALQVNWKIEHEEFLCRMMEYAAAILKSRERPTLHISFVEKVTPECDCLSYSDAPICPDLGVAASFDPVALDQACIDMVSKAPCHFPSKLPLDTKPGDNKFLKLNPKLPEAMGLDYAEELGIGTREYVIKNI